MIIKKRLVQLTKKVISINSENPPGNEFALSKFIEKDMKSLGLAIKKVSYEKDRPNIIATLRGSLPRKEAARNAILITPHFDTVPIGKGWKFNPLGQIVNGRIYGRGATDDKGNLACCMEVMRSLVEDNVRLKRDIIMAATVDEETGSHAGIVPLLEKKVLKPKEALIVDSDEYDCIIAQKGLLHCRVQIQGRKAHGAYNWRGVNAIEQAAEIISLLKQYRFRYKKHPLLHGPTVNVGIIQGGDKVNMVADFCEVALDIRFMPGMKSSNVIKQVKDVINKVTKRYQFIIDDLQQPYEINRNHPFIRSFVQTARKCRIKATLKGSEGATVITFFKKHGIPAFATGFGTHGNAHTTDEFAKIGILYRGSQLLERFLIDYDKCF